MQGDGLRALDAGCGPGDLTAELLERGFNVKAFDISPYAVERARSVAPPSALQRLELSVGDIYNQPPTPVYDLILLVEVLEHVPDDKEALRCAAACLKPGGTLILTVPAHPSLWSEADVFSLHYRRYRRRELFDLAESAGLSIRRLDCFGFPLLRTYYLFKNLLASPERFATSVEDNPSCEDLSHTLTNSEPAKAFGVRAYRFLMDTALSLDKRLTFTDLGVGYAAFLSH